MSASKSFSRRALVSVMVMMTLLLVLFSAAHYYILETLSARVDMLSQATELLAEHRVLIDQFEAIGKTAGVYYVPAAALILITIGLLLWKSVCSQFNALSVGAVPKTEHRVERRPPAVVEETPRKAKDEQLFLHLLSVLQRDGRLVDFLAEDLSHYEDGQIGAAVRTIHAGCKRATEKYLDPLPVLDLPEGHAYTVGPDFDPAAIKLTGNVSGQPPFEGIVRHKGWRAGRIDLPGLSAGRDVRIIAPAEVEIL
jgi:hypothetical protein